MLPIVAVVAAVVVDFVVVSRLLQLRTAGLEPDPGPGPGPGPVPAHRTKGQTKRTPGGWVDFNLNACCHFYAILQGILVFSSNV